MTLAPECSFQWDGAVIAILLGAIPLALVITMVTLLLYRLAIGRAMRTGSTERRPAQETPASARPGNPLEIVLVSHGRKDVSKPENLDISERSRLGLSLANTLADYRTCPGSDESCGADGLTRIRQSKSGL